MSTPSKNLQKFAESMPMLLDNLKSISEQLIAVKNDFDDLIKWRTDPDAVRNGLKRSQESTNRAIERARKMTDLINSECASVREAFLFGEEEMKGFHKPENITIDTAMKHKAPKLTARIGFEEAKKRLYKIRPANEKMGLITARQLNGCFGFRPSESHFVEFWMEALPYGKDDMPIKTNGMLTMTAGNRGFFFFQCEEFLKTYYKNYHVGLIKGEIKAISTRKDGKLVRFV